MTNWTVPRDWTRGEMVTETMLNTHVRDNLLHLKENQTALGGLFSGVALGTHIDNDIAAKAVQLRRADRIVFDDGSAVSNLSALTADVTLAGAGGLDTGSEAASTWYEIYGIHKSSDGTSSLMLHRAKNWLLDETYDSDDATVEIRKATGTRTAVGQGVQVSNTGYVDFIDVELIRVSTVSGTMYAELHTDSAGVPSGTVLATSDKLNAADVSTTAQWVRFIFRTPASLTAATQYHLVLTGSWTENDSVYIGWRCDTSSASYANGTRTQKEGGTWNNTSTTTHDFSFKVYVRENDSAVTMPSGYDGKCLVGYVYNDSSSDFVKFTAIDRLVVPLVDGGVIIVPDLPAANPTLIDASAVVPPIPLYLHFHPNTLGAGILWVMPVPGGYKTPGGAHRDGGAVGQPAGQQRVLEVPIETQAVYTYNTVGNYDLWLDSWEW